MTFLLLSFMIADLFLSNKPYFSHKCVKFHHFFNLHPLFLMLQYINFSFYIYIYFIITIGTPIIAVESGIVEALGWNQYGGWRIGIRSLDNKRYYYYAHLRKNYPYQSNLEIGSRVQAGDVIGYMGRTGYSRKENTNNIDEPHLHFGIQLIFDESQKEGNNEIWISCYELVKFLRQNQCLTQKIPDTKEWQRVYKTEDK